MTRYLMKNFKKATVLYNIKWLYKFNLINVGVVGGVAMIIGGGVITGCGLSLKQFWKSWSLCNRVVALYPVSVVERLGKRVSRECVLVVV